MRRKQQEKDKVENVAWDAEQVLNWVGDEVKTGLTDGGTINGEAIQFASRSTTTSAHDNSTAYAGAAFGVIGLGALFAMATTCKGGKYNSHTESLL